MNNISKFFNEKFKLVLLLELSIGLILIIGVVFLYLDKYFFKLESIYLLKYFLYDYITEHYVVICLISIATSLMLFYTARFTSNNSNENQSGTNNESYPNGEEGTSSNSSSSVQSKNNTSDSTTNNSIANNNDFKKMIFAYSRNPKLFKENKPNDLLKIENNSNKSETNTNKGSSDNESNSENGAQKTISNNNQISEANSHNNSENKVEETSTNSHSGWNTTTNDNTSNNINKIFLQIMKYNYFIFSVSLIIVHLIGFFYFYNILNDYFLSKDFTKVIKLKNNSDNLQPQTIEIKYSISEYYDDTAPLTGHKYWASQDKETIVKLREIKILLNNFQYKNLEEEIEKRTNARE